MKFQIFLVFVILMAAVHSSAAEKRIFLTTTEYKPFCSMDLKNQGAAAQIVKQAFKKTGYRVKMEFYPWKRCLEMAKMGVSDGVAFLWYAKEREEWFLFSDPLGLPNIMGFYKRSDRRIRFRNYDDLAPHVIGYIYGFAYPREFYAASARLRCRYFYSHTELMENLVSGKIDLALIGRHQAEYILKTRFPEHIRDFDFMEPAVEIREHFIAVSRKVEDFDTKVADFNRGLHMIRKDGTLERILLQHGMK